MTIRVTILTGVLFLGFAACAHATDWAQWRGPAHNGSTDETGLPAAVDPATDVAWRAPLPGTSSATPIVSGDAVFVITNDETQQKVVALCLDRATGALRWQHVLGEMAKVRGRNDTASISPVTDGKTVYLMCSTGTLFALDFDGKLVWQKHLPDAYGAIGPQFGYASTPLLLDGRLYLPFLHGQWGTEIQFDDYTDKDSFLVCLDAATGNEIWKHHRPTDAKGESFDSYASMVPFISGGVPALLVQGGDHLSAHQRTDGEELWRHAHNTSKETHWRLIPSPLAAGDFAIGIEPRGGDLFAVLPGEKKQLAYEEATWLFKGPTSDVPCPALYEGKLYIVTGTKGNLICLDPKNGTLLWEGDLGVSARVWGSPTLADGKIFCLDEKGQVTIASIRDGLKDVTHAEFNSTVSKSTLAISGGQLYVRASDALYCVGKAKG